MSNRRGRKRQHCGKCGSVFNNTYRGCRPLCHMCRISNNQPRTTFNDLPVDVLSAFVPLAAPVLREVPAYGSVARFHWVYSRDLQLYTKVPRPLHQVTIHQVTTIVRKVPTKNHFTCACHFCHEPCTLQLTHTSKPFRIVQGFQQQRQSFKRTPDACSHLITSTGYTMRCAPRNRCTWAFDQTDF